MRIAAKIEYKGTNYHGFERQKSGIATIQETLECALSKIADEQIYLTVAGRTDKGVHAIGQIIHFDTNKKRDINAWIHGTNTHLPRDISILKANKIDDEFNARFSAISRTYQYRIINRSSRVSIESDIVYWVPEPLDIVAMQQAAQYLLGEHDFSAFRASACQAKTPNRHIHQINIKQSKENIITTITGNAFLYHMVRNIMGTLLKVGKKQKPIHWVEQVLKSKNRAQAGDTITARGLTLVAVQYPDKYQNIN